MINPFKPSPADAPENRDICFRYNRYRRYLGRQRRREKRRNMSLYVMLPVMAAALIISLYHTFAPKRQLLPTAESAGVNLLPDRFLQSLDNASTRLDSILHVFMPDDSVSARQLRERFDSLDPNFDLFLGEPGLGTFLNVVSACAEFASVGKQAEAQAEKQPEKR